MEPHEYAISHFEGMARLARAFKSLPALILEHSYSGQSFGHWNIVLKHKGRAARITFDGKDDSLGVAFSSNRKSPYAFSVGRHIEVIGGVRELDDAAIEKIVSNVAHGPD